MEEMNKEIMENGAIEIVEEVTDKLTFGQNCLAYALAGTFVIGVTTVGYLGYRGTKMLVNKIKDKKKITVEESGEDIVDVEEEDIQEDVNESEDK
jgi:hypothetical protein